ncbi:MAG TPA: DUF2062 domain-containing protein [Gammaproteobacteria bacterium]|nr:DUF2062 domain-containing protein [Gammaproteobacteria bacterium]
MDDAAKPGRLAKLRDNKLTRHVLELLKQGITPHKIALAVVLGALLGMAPVLGSTIISCTVAALALRLNLVLIQLVNNLVYPLQLLLLIPFVQAGQRLFGQPPMPLSAGQIVDMVRHDFWGSLLGLAGYVWHGTVAWLLFCALIGPLSYWLLLFPLKRALRRQPDQSQ